MFTGEKAVKFGRAIRMSMGPTLGLAGLFPIRPGNVFVAEKVEYDIIQEKEAMSIPVKRGDEPNKNTGSTFQTLSETPPYISESAPFNVMDLKGRFPGVDKYSDADTSLTSKLMAYITSMYAQIQRKNDRQIEWQAAQILRTGQLPFSVFDPLVPTPVADITFNMNAEMFPDAVAAWSGATAKQMDDDIIALGDLMRIKGKKMPTDVILGRDANYYFWKVADHQSLLDNRRTEIGFRAPQALQQDGFALEGEMKVGPYKLRFWTYEGWYDDPNGAGMLPYMDVDDCIVLADGGERDRYHAGVDVVIPASAEISSLIPGAGLQQVASSQAAISMPWAYTDLNKKTTTIGIDSSPLLVPTNRAAHGNINTNP
jgi:hypothetical protein